MIVSIISAAVRLVVGLAFGVGSAVALAPLGAAFKDEEGGGGFMMIVVVALVTALTFFAPSIRRAFGRGFLVLGASVFALPLSTFLLAGRVTNDMMNQAAAGEAGYAAAGGVIAGGLVTGVATFFGLILGSILLLAGLILSLGGRREVVVVQPSAPSPRPAAPVGPRRVEPRLIAQPRTIEHDPAQVEFER